ncbi:uncharacterized protein LOC104891326 [Beta vulgaris subsp. vulgaris]|uniref:uncharacterized protein LOC104891326 n=1 Tax=Beta vulgaris subsp. vulgaris TaxID=3555 RepID=UPI00203684CD|nr:uncharacterized protein LOC104891326 [Beta vulgaris subsp. vulgaris]
MFYKNLLSPCANSLETIDLPVVRRGTMLSIEARRCLISLIRASEIDSALANIDDNKAPGVDGFNALFFKKVWHLIKTDVYQGVQEFLQGAELYRPMNITLITLIPKVDQAMQAKDFRPIACSSMLYKIIDAKVLTNRLGQVYQSGSILPLGQVCPSISCVHTSVKIDIRCLRSLNEIPESAAISVLDQFLLSGADENDKGAFLAGLITKYQVRSFGISQVPEYTSRANESISVRSDLVRLRSRSQVPALDSFSSHMATSRYERYSPRLPYFDYSLSPRAGITRTSEERNSSPMHLPVSSSSYGKMGMKSPVIQGASHQPTRSQVRFDPFTGEPYKFDPFIGEPIQPESLSRGNQSFY